MARTVTVTVATRTVGAREEHRVEDMAGCGFLSRWDGDRATVEGWADLHDEAACELHRREQARPPVWQLDYDED